MSNTTTDKRALTRSSVPISKAATEVGAKTRYLGIDPGLIRTGYAVLERSANGPILCEGGVIRSTQKLSLAKRVHEIACGIREVIQEFSPDVMAIEQVVSLVRNPKSALLMAHARGAILFAACDHDIPVEHYAPTQVKRLLTGSGKASKTQIQRAIRNELRLDCLLEPNDVADACAIALCHYHSPAWLVGTNLHNRNNARTG